VCKVLTSAVTEGTVVAAVGAVTEGTVVAAVSEGGTTRVSCVQIDSCMCEGCVLLQTQNKKGIKVSGTYCLAETPVRRL